MDSVILFENPTVMWYVANAPRFKIVNIVSVVFCGNIFPGHDLQLMV